MTRTTMRWTLAVGLAAAVAGLAPAWGTADAAPSTGSPFAGSYEGAGPVDATLVMQADISGSGRVTGLASWTGFGMTGKHKLSGTVTADGTFTYRVDYSITGHPRGWIVRSAGAAADEGLADAATTTFGTATLVKNPDGSVTSTACTGTPIVWTPR